MKRGFPVVYMPHDRVVCPDGNFFNYRTESGPIMCTLSLSCVSAHCDGGIPFRLAG